MSVLPKQPKRQAIQTLAFYSDDMSWSPRNACMLVCDVTLLDHSRSSSGDTFFYFKHKHVENQRLLCILHLKIELEGMELLQKKQFLYMQWSSLQL